MRRNVREHEHGLARIGGDRIRDHLLAPLHIKTFRHRLRKDDIGKAFDRTLRVRTVLGSDQTLHIGEGRCRILAPQASFLLALVIEIVVRGIHEKLLRALFRGHVRKDLFDRLAICLISRGIMVVRHVSDIDHQVHAVLAEELIRKLYPGAALLGLADMRVGHHADAQLRLFVAEKLMRRSHEGQRTDTADEISSFYRHITPPRPNQLRGGKSQPCRCAKSM